MLLGKKGMDVQAPIFVRIFKEESELEIWKLRDDGRYHHFKTYPICTWSGELGPKLQAGDKQAPEGFYEIHKRQMNPNSSFHLAFNLGYPNAFDKSHGRTGSALMVHGKCKSAGCYAMTDALIEEIYALARDQYTGVRETFPVHAFPFRMTDENMARFKGNQWYPFWTSLKDGHDAFETSRQVPTVTICDKRYHINVKPAQSTPLTILPDARCPKFERVVVEPFTPAPVTKGQAADAQFKAPGPKMRTFASNRPATVPGDTAGILSGFTTEQPVPGTGLGFRAAH